ncbi:unnamed protein product [Hymenolepis diminuta]|uniref:Uncharacterized protein n=1 Tax=Hymenolepis diminuta TaxID=6216 RepID=A0A564YXF4_HYMDI|nr:unnamed protein product [Hymenolepis diminuta]
MAEPICRREEFHISPPSYFFSPQPSRRRVDFVGGNYQRTLSPNSCASSSTNTTEYSMIGENSRCEDISPLPGYPMPKMGDGLGISRTKKGTRAVNIKTFKLVEPNHDRQQFCMEGKSDADFTLQMPEDYNQRYQYG